MPEEFAEDGRSVLLSGQVLVPEEVKDLQMLWVLAVAYDEGGQPVGVRRWQADDLTGAVEIPFVIQVFSLGGKIEEVDLLVEARP